MSLKGIQLNVHNINLVCYASGEKMPPIGPLNIRCKSVNQLNRLLGKDKALGYTHNTTQQTYQVRYGTENIQSCPYSRPGRNTQTDTLETKRQKNNSKGQRKRLKRQIEMKQTCR